MKSCFVRLVVFRCSFTKIFSGRRTDTQGCFSASCGLPRRSWSQWSSPAICSEMDSHGQSSRTRKDIYVYKRIPARLVEIIVAIVASFCVIALARVSLRVGLQTVIDYNEGWNAYFQAASVSSGILYPDHGMMFNNYPPLSFPIVGLLGKITGDMISAGRLISFLAFLGITVGIYAAARMMEASKLKSAFAATFFAGTILVVVDYVGANDPQMLGTAIGMAGFVCVLGAPHRRIAILFGALVLTLAGFVKHNLIVQPLVLLIWLAIYSRNLALWFAAAGIVFAAVGVAVTNIVCQTNLIADLLLPRLYSVHHGLQLIGKWLVIWLVPMGGLAMCARRMTSDRYMVLCIIYVAVAVVIGGFFVGGAGTGSSSLFDVVIALALSTGMALNRWRQQAHQRALFALACVLPLAFVMMARHGRNWTPEYWLHPYAAERAVTARDIAFLQKQHAPIACELLAFCYWAGKPAEVDFFNLSQAVLAGKRSDDALIARINAHEFNAIQVVSLDNHRETGGTDALVDNINPPFSGRVRDALIHAYRIDHTDEKGAFLVPMEPAQDDLARSNSKIRYDRNTAQR